MKQKVFKGRVASIQASGFSFFDFEKIGFSYFGELALPSDINVGDYIEFSASFAMKEITIYSHQKSKKRRMQESFACTLF